MDRLEMVIELVNMAKNERDRLKAMATELNDTDDWGVRINIYQRYTPQPTKAAVNDALKMARRLLAEEYL